MMTTALPGMLQFFFYFDMKEFMNYLSVFTGGLMNDLIYLPQYSQNKEYFLYDLPFTNEVV